ncbi:MULTISPECIES: response regulator transcription factor [Flavobacterium]|uniref:LuxR family transcriptional regulator protein n=2 Tax=Flavobacterium TaxID=237 RepID=G8XA64_FLACA|nr:LuxR C-terminal-related transcriptional regulator [Flavobacterium columnare]AEW85922.1 LuxR family transcriptional regulator protein [Flavobacterium columnare ATCC 49512]
MQDKFNQNELIHQLPAGLIIGDKRTELFGCRKTKKVFSISNGVTKPFKELDNFKKALIFEQLLSDNIALEDLKNLPQEEALEQFAFCVYGDANHEPDFCENGELQKADNFLCSNNCRCLKWQSKSIYFNNKKITVRQIEILQLLASDLCDKQIADKLCISESTLNTHKSNLFKLFEVHSRTGLISKAITNKIIQ